MRRTSVVILAAGQGKRMHSDLAKVLQPAAGRPLIHWVLDAVPQAPVAVVVGKGRAEVEAAVRAYGREVTFVEQPEQLGTGHAVRCAMDSPWGEAATGGEVLVVPGDQPLMTAELLRSAAAPLNGQVRVISTHMPDPSGYGRILRAPDGAVRGIVEHKDAPPEQRKIDEIATSVFLFNGEFLKTGLARLSSNNKQNEYYLTDLVEEGADSLVWPHHEDLRGVNNLWELAEVGKVLNRRVLKSWALKGVRFIDPDTTWVDGTVDFAENVVVHPGVHVKGRTKIRAGVVIKPGCVLEDSEIGAESQVGPYAHLRPQSKVGRKCKIGNFVELKKTTIGDETSVSHLSYLGDAQVGSRVNIGCGFITCNFDGRTIDGKRKHETIIGDDVFMGSDCQVIAPIEIGDGAYVASGSTVNKSVESGALAIARTRQVTKKGYARRLRAGVGTR